MKESYRENLASSSGHKPSAVSGDAPGVAWVRGDACDLNSDGQADVTESGQPLAMKTPANEVTTLAYDVMGRQVLEVLPNSTSKFTAYHPNGQVKVTWGSQTYPTWTVYDEQGRKSQLHTWKVAPPLNPSAVPATPPAGSEITQWIYGPTTGHLTRKQYADAKGTNYTYTPAGRLSTRTWQRATGSVVSDRNKEFLIFSEGWVWA
jgi:YD repeat-containing protein